jgi:succinate dehydrogenase hydrophobic anchor subunit
LFCCIWKLLFFFPVYVYFHLPVTTHCLRAWFRNWRSAVSLLWLFFFSVLALWALKWHQQIWNRYIWCTVFGLVYEAELYLRHRASVGRVTFCVFPMFITLICDRDTKGNKRKWRNLV